MITDADLHATALAVYQEARGEPFKCQVLVASVVRNRMEDERKNAHHIIHQHGQFTWNHKAPVKDWKAYNASLKVASYVLHAPTVSPYRYFRKGKHKGHVCGGQVFTVKYWGEKD